MGTERYGEGSWAGLVAEKLFDNLFVPACSPSLGLTDPAQLRLHTREWVLTLPGGLCRSE